MMPTSVCGSSFIIWCTTVVFPEPVPPAIPIISMGVVFSVEPVDKNSNFCSIATYLKATNLANLVSFCTPKIVQTRPSQTRQSHISQDRRGPTLVGLCPIRPGLWHHFAFAKGVRVYAPHCPNARRVDTIRPPWGCFSKGVNPPLFCLDAPSNARTC